MLPRLSPLKDACHHVGLKTDKTQKLEVKFSNAVKIKMMFCLDDDDSNNVTYLSIEEWRTMIICFLILIKIPFIFSCRTWFVCSRFILQRRFYGWIQGYFNRWCRSWEEEKGLPPVKCWIFFSLQVEREGMVVRFKIAPHVWYIAPHT